jgi:lipoprotein-anchoring transpeptidase ErfK/SrfK
MRPLTGLVVAALSAITVAGLAPAAGAREALAPKQDVALLLRTQRVFATPQADRPRVGTVRAVRPITYGQTALPVIGRTTGADGRRWWRVMLPGRPNGSTGWISREGTIVTSTRWHIVVRTARRRALVYRDGRLVRSFAAIVGKSSTPTPQGEFFVEENVIMPRGAPGAPYALALSARSNVYQEFEGGPGQIGIHGIANLGGTLGTAASNGCVRLSNGSITWLAARIDPGAPVTITS